MQANTRTNTRTNTKAMMRLLAAATTAACLGLTAGASAKSIDLPADTAQLKASPLPGFAKAQAQCTICHSAEYMLYQPPSAARPYWDAMVKRMKQVFNAPVTEADMPDIVDYLTKTYGNEQGK